MKQKSNKMARVVQFLMPRQSGYSNDERISTAPALTMKFKVFFLTLSAS
jgi:hypothetical protein